MLANVVRIRDNTHVVNKKFERQVEKAVLKATMRLHQEVVRVLSGTRTGRRYKIAGSNVFYTASAEGEAPASRLGILRNSYKYKTKGKGYETAGYVGSSLKYAEHLEKGTARMKPRPHLQKALEQAGEDIERILRTAFDE